MEGTWLSVSPVNLRYGRGSLLWGGKGSEGKVELLTLSSAKGEDLIVNGSYCKGICCLGEDKLASFREKPTEITSHNDSVGNSDILASVI